MIDFYVRIQTIPLYSSAGHIQTSESFLLKAREYSLPDFNIEKAKHMRSEVCKLTCSCSCIPLML